MKVLTPRETERLYADARKMFSDLHAKAAVVPQGCSSRLVESQRPFWASVLFVRLIVMSASAVRLAPRTGRFPEKRAIWDLGSPASVVRNLVEAYFVSGNLTSSRSSGQNG